MPRHTIIVMMPPGFRLLRSPRYRILKELRTKSRKAEIMNGFERVRLHVFGQESYVGDPCCLRVFAPEFQKSVAAIDSQNRSRRAHQPDQLHRGVAEAAARVNNLIARLYWQTRKDCLAVECQSIHENVLPADEFWHKHAIPEVDVLTVLALFLRKSFSRHITPPKSLRTSRGLAAYHD